MKKNNVKKVAAVLLAVVMVVGCSIGATVAYLQMKTDSIKNTFTTSDVTITLTESKGEGTDLAKSFKMVPGAEIKKDPTVTVSTDSEDCYVFVKIDESANLDQYISYAVNVDVWTELDGVDGVYYFVADTAAKKGYAYSVLAENKVTVNTSVTKDMMTTAETAIPTMTFTAYAIQKNYLPNGGGAAAAWNLVKDIQ